ncbi:MAG: helix-turn-helix domain-containing protein [Actinobacteria bacterium]|nr:helix-turn-helix domain-containing protein [Actinomycetota bacterium]
MVENLLTCTETAEHLGVPEKTLAQWRYHGKGPAYVKIGKYVRYRPGDVAAYLAENTVQPRPAA